VSSPLLSADQIAELAAALWAARSAAADDPARPTPADRPYTPALIMGGVDQCPHGVQRGRRCRPGHGTPGCPLCRADYLAAARDLSQHTAPCVPMPAALRAELDRRCSTRDQGAE